MEGGGEVGDGWVELRALVWLFIGRLDRNGSMHFKVETWHQERFGGAMMCLLELLYRFKILKPTPC